MSDENTEKMVVEVEVEGEQAAIEKLDAIAEKAREGARVLYRNPDTGRIMSKSAYIAQYGDAGSGGGGHPDSPAQPPYGVGGGDDDGGHPDPPRQPPFGTGLTQRLIEGARGHLIDEGHIPYGEGDPDVAPDAIFPTRIIGTEKGEKTVRNPIYGQAGTEVRARADEWARRLGTQYKQGQGLQGEAESESERYSAAMRARELAFAPDDESRGNLMVGWAQQAGGMGTSEGLRLHTQAELHYRKHDEAAQSEDEQQAGQYARYALGRYNETRASYGSNLRANADEHARIFAGRDEADDRTTQANAKFYEGKYLSTVDSHNENKAAIAKAEARNARMLEEASEAIEEEIAARKQATRQLQIAKAGTHQERADLLGQFAKEDSGTVSGLRLQASQARELRAVENGADEAGGERASRFMGLRIGRLGQYATWGFAAYEATQALKSSQERDTSLAVAGNDQEAQFNAYTKYAQSVESVHIVGPIAGLATGMGQRLGASEATVSAAHAQDSWTSQIAANAEYTRLAGQRATLASYNTDEFGRREAEIGFTHDNALAAAQQHKNETGQVAAVAINANNAAAQARLDAALHSRAIQQNLQGLGSLWGLTNAGTTAEVAAANANLDSTHTASKQLRHSAADIEKKAQDAATNAADREQTYQRLMLGLDKLAYRVGIGASIASSEAAGNHDPFGAQLATLGGSAIQEWLKAPSGMKAEVFRRGAAAVKALFAETTYQVAGTSAQIMGQVAASELESQGYGLQAAQKGISTNEDKALHDLPQNPIFAPIVHAIKAQAAEAQRRALIQYQQQEMMNSGSVSSGWLGVQRMPLEAGIAQAEAGLSARSVGRDPTSTAAYTDRLLTALSESQMRQKQSDNIAMVSLNQATRSAQLAALGKFDPVGAEVAGIYGGARAEEMGYLQQGPAYDAQAKKARQLGQEQLDVTRKQYLRSFRGEELDLRTHYVMNPRDVEDPTAILANIAKASKDLDTPGSASGGGNPPWITPLATEIANQLRTLMIGV